MTAQTKRGIILAVITAIISGFSIFYNKIVVTRGIDPVIFNIVKNGGVALVLSLLLIKTNHASRLMKLRRPQWLKLFAIALVGGSIPFLLFFEGLRSVPAVNANIIHKSLFLWVALLAIPILGERLTKWQVLGYVLVAWSNVMLGGFMGFTGSTAEFMILGATMLWAVENIIAKRVLRDLPSPIVAWARMFFGTGILIAIAGSQQKLSLFWTITQEQLLAASGSIILLTGYVLTWYHALKLAPATLVASVLILATPITNVLSAIFVTHAFPQPQLLNLVATVIGLLFIARLFASGKKMSAATVS